MASFNDANHLQQKLMTSFNEIDEKYSFKYLLFFNRVKMLKFRNFTYKIHKNNDNTKYKI